MVETGLRVHLSNREGLLGETDGPVLLQGASCQPLQQTE
jgi:hypothetical protein